MTDPVQRQRLVDEECLVAYLHDGLDAWDLGPDGRYMPARGAGKARPWRAGGTDGTLCRPWQDQSWRLDCNGPDLWRHAEAVELDQLKTWRVPLTVRGEKQAMRMAAWLDRQMPERARVLVSPARRTRANGNGAGTQVQVAPWPGPLWSVLNCWSWHSGPQQRLHWLWAISLPLGRTVAQLMGLSAQRNVRGQKGAVWWLRHRERDGVGQTVVVAVQSRNYCSKLCCGLGPLGPWLKQGPVPGVPADCELVRARVSMPMVNLARGPMNTVTYTPDVLCGLPRLMPRF